MPDVCLNMPRANILLRGSKSDQKGVKVILDHAPEAVDVCKVMNLSKYLQARPGRSGSLFVHLDGSQVTRYQFQAVVKKAADFLDWDKRGFFVKI